jgi:hypothetical protein
LSAVLSLAIPGILAEVSHIFFGAESKKDFGRKNALAAVSSHETVLGQRINVRFFLAVNAALVLFGLALTLVPCATTVRGKDHQELLNGLVAIVSVAGFSILGLLYSVRKGDMSWVDSFHRLQDAKPTQPKERKN